eukprot:31560-Pelagococcus_subviridis.AAC.6
MDRSRRKNPGGRRRAEPRPRRARRRSPPSPSDARCDARLATRGAATRGAATRLGRVRARGRRCEARKP